MTLLVDNQLPLALARYLAANAWDCVHVQDIGLDAAEDRIIWQYSKERSLNIITKDEDFHQKCEVLSRTLRSVIPCGNHGQMGV
jgi:predicted nuclease of predicted toxin-antitoxin system